MTVKEGYPLPSADMLLDQLADAKYYTKIDIRWAYHQIKIAHGREWKTAFSLATESLNGSSCHSDSPTLLQISNNTPTPFFTNPSTGYSLSIATRSSYAAKFGRNTSNTSDTYFNYFATTNSLPNLTTASLTLNLWNTLASTSPPTAEKCGQIPPCSTSCHKSRLLACVWDS